jgi:alpha-L-arabinofuranosidase
MPALLPWTIVMLGSCVGQQAEPRSDAVLRNPGFESPRVLDGWDVVTYGAASKVEPDRMVVHEGRQALRISASESSDTALGQEVTLRPRGWYLLHGWVRTRGLDPLDAPVCGTFQVQHAGGRGIIAAGPSHSGDTDWTKVELAFQAPADGRVRIAPFLVGFGKGTGTAWFDGITLEGFQPSQATTVITREFLQSGRIEQGQYGQFIEYLCDLVPGMWADKLCDAGFEGLSPYNRLVYLKETDFREHPWYPCGATNRGKFDRDTATQVGGSSSYRISAEEDVPCTLGIAQDAIALEQGMPCTFSIYLKQKGMRGAVTVRLHREGTEYAACEFQPSGEWAKYQARLVPRATVHWATISIEFHGPGTLWLDSARLMPDDAIGGWRKDVVGAVKAMKPGVIRFGGSAVDVTDAGDFEWRDTIGDPDRRKTLRAWGGLQPAGPGLEEIVQFCRLVDAEPLICVRVVGRTPRDAADQIQYFNGSAETPMGALRKRNGHAEPYHIKYWQIGNEQGGPNYERQLPDFCKAMKEADPSIELLASYPRPGVIRGAGAWLDHVSPHHYDCADLAGCESELISIRKRIAELAPGRKIRVAVTEWNTTAGDAGPRRARLWTLENALACSRYHNLIHRHCDLVPIANRSNLVNSFCSGCVQTDSHRLYKTPTYYAQQLYATMAGDRPLRIESPLPPISVPDFSATMAADGKSVMLFAVNDGREPIERPLDFSAFGQNGQTLEILTLTDTRHAGEPDVTNRFADPERVVPIRSTLNAASPRFTYPFPPLSLTVMRWSVR